MGDKYFFCLAQAGYELLAQGHKAHLPYICSFYVKETSYTTLRRERTIPSSHEVIWHRKFS